MKLGMKLVSDGYDQIIKMDKNMVYMNLGMKLDKYSNALIIKMIKEMV